MNNNQALERGTYMGKDLYGASRKIIVLNDRVNVYTPNGVFIAQTTIESAREQYRKLKPETKANKLYNIAWMVAGEVRETISVNATHAVVKHKINQLRAQYSPGLLMPVPSNLS